MDPSAARLPTSTPAGAARTANRVPPEVVTAIVGRPEVWRPWTAKAMVDLVDRVAGWVADPEVIDSLTYVPWEQIGRGVDLTGSDVRPARLPGLLPHEAQAAWLRIERVLGLTDGGRTLWTTIGRHLGSRPAPIVQTALDHLDLDRPASLRAVRSAVVAALAEPRRRDRTGAAVIEPANYVADPQFEVFVEDTLRWAWRIGAR